MFNVRRYSDLAKKNLDEKLFNGMHLCIPKGAQCKIQNGRTAQGGKDIFLKSAALQIYSKPATHRLEQHIHPYRSPT